MSKMRGIGGLVLATVFGIANGVAVFGPAFKEQKQQSTDTNGEAEAPPSNEDAVPNVKKAPEITTAIELSAESATSQSSSKKQPFDLNWPSLSPKWNWKDFWREGDRALNETARTDSRQPES